MEQLDVSLNFLYIYITIFILKEHETLCIKSGKKSGIDLELLVREDKTFFYWLTDKSNLAAMVKDHPTFCSALIFLFFLKTSSSVHMVTKGLLAGITKLDMPVLLD
jgi:hypothetical protein